MLDLVVSIVRVHCGLHCVRFVESVWYHVYAFFISIPIIYVVLIVMRNVADTEDSSDMEIDTHNSIRCACTSSFDVALFRPLMQTSCFGLLVFADSRDPGLAELMVRVVH